MNRSGAALFVALVVVLLAAMLVVVSTMVGAAEIRAGTSWALQQHASGLAEDAFARALPAVQTRFDSLASGSTFPLDDTVSVTRMDDSLALVTVAASSRLGREVYVSLARTGVDSTGTRWLRIPRHARVRYHPVP